jgi:hypothetical protein
VDRCTINSTYSGVRSISFRANGVFFQSERRHIAQGCFGATALVSLNVVAEVDREDSTKLK